MGSISPFSTRKRRYATVVTQNPAGTGTPAAVSSPRLAPLPPTSARLPASTSSSVRITDSMASPLHFAQEPTGAPGQY